MIKWIEKKRREKKRKEEKKQEIQQLLNKDHDILLFTGWLAGWAGWVGWRADLRAAGVAGLRAGQPVCGRKGIHPATAGNAGTAQKQFETI